MSFENTYLILGASSDLGVELIKSLNSEKSNSLFLAHYNSSKSKFDEIPMQNGNVIEAMQCDLSNPDSVDEFIAQIQEKTDAPTHIVQLAADSFKYMRLKEFSREALLKSIDIQVCSFAAILKKFLPVMAKRKAHNKIVIMLTSYILDTPPKFVLEYMIAKSALLGLMRSVATDYVGKFVNVNALSPSMIETKFLKNIDERIVQMTAEKSPEERNATPADIVPVIKFLLSDSANYIHGANLNVCNGGGQFS